MLRTTPGGLLRINHTAIAAKAKLDGTCPLRCSDPKLNAEDIALGYKQLLQVERGWLDLSRRSTCGRSTTAPSSASARTRCCAGWRC